MRPGSVVSGAAFKSAAVSLAVFVLTLVIAGLSIFFLVKAVMIDELKRQITEEILLFNEIYEKNGEKALVDSIAQLKNLQLANQNLAGLFDEDASKLAGNLDIAPEFLGWKKLSLDAAEATGENNYFTFTGRIDKTTIIVGRSLRFIEVVLDSLLWLLILSGTTVSVISLLVGYYASRGVFIKLDKLAFTLDQVSRGDTEVRLPIGDSNDQIDRISRQINTHIERISTLISITRNTATSIAHDLRTPLNRAYLVLQEAREHDVDGKQLSELIQRAENELENVGQIFDTILRISQIEAATNQASFTNISANELLENITEIYDPVIEAAEQKLSFRPAEFVDAAIYGDRSMLRQMLVNLVENSSFHCPRGVAIELSARISSDGGTCIEVSDNGPGIPAEFRKQVLEPFYRLDASRNKPGSGLGLALVKAVAVRHGASISLLDNNPGLRISICFPVVEAST